MATDLSVFDHHLYRLDLLARNGMSDSHAAKPVQTPLHR